MGRGWSTQPRLTSISMEKSPLYEVMYQFDDHFQELCGWSPGEFDGLFNDVRDVLLMTHGSEGSNITVGVARSRNEARTRTCTSTYRPTYDD